MREGYGVGGKPAIAAGLERGIAGVVENWFVADATLL